MRFCQFCFSLRIRILFHICCVELPFHVLLSSLSLPFAFASLSWVILPSRLNWLRLRNLEQQTTIVCCFCWGLSSMTYSSCSWRFCDMYSRLLAASVCLLVVAVDAVTSACVLLVAAGRAWDDVKMFVKKFHMIDTGRKTSEKKSFKKLSWDARGTSWFLFDRFDDFESQ